MKFLEAVAHASQGKKIRPKDSIKDFIFYDYGTFRWVHAAGGKVELYSIEELAGEWEVEGGEPEPAFLQSEKPVSKKSKKE